MIAGIILAAGESSRMGRDKALLLIGQETFLQHLIGVLKGRVSPLVIVLGHHAEEIAARLSTKETCTEPIAILRNPDYRLGQLSSLKVALRHLSGQPPNAVLVALVDHPAISASVVDLLVERFAKNKAPVLIPTFQGRRGHPVIFAQNLFTELLDAPLDEGARVVVRRHESEVELVGTDEEGIVLDIDLPADYAALLKQQGKATTDK